MLLRDTHCFYDNIKYIDDTDSASDQFPWIKNLEAESKNIVKVTEKTKSKKRKANQVNLGVKSKVLRTNNRFKKLEDNDINYKKNCDNTRRKRTRNFQQSQQENVPEVKKKKLKVLRMKKKCFKQY